MRKKQRHGWGTGDQAEQHYLVQPRTLAGGGDLRHITEYLRAAGWTDKSQVGGPLVFASPDTTVRVGYDPFVQPGGWTISGRATAAQDAWHAFLGQRTPVEIVAGLTDALAGPRSAHAPNAWAPLVQQNWSVAREPHFTATSPNSDSWVQWRQEDDGPPYWWAGAQTEQGRSWSANFTSTTPLHLVAAFTSALADPAPVMRPLGHVPPSNRITTRSASVLPSELRDWQQNRIEAGLAVRVQRPRATPGARPPQGWDRARSAGKLR
ncbi:DUF317 domain-containing protein [Streptomyces griseus]|uniref:DUF317 domain-containing protein n=1 Tax=Streptomyces griseus TaxID=1911 RepID=UPI0038694E86|nr:DUF317 domain-containing protein [Streptomyces fimicarius]